MNGARLTVLDLIRELDGLTRNDITHILKSHIKDNAKFNKFTLDIPFECYQKLHSNSAGTTIFAWWNVVYNCSLKLNEYFERYGINKDK